MLKHWRRHRVNQELISFYRGDGQDCAGRTIDEILSWDHAKLESVHDYIQWLFPSATPSQFNSQAPLLDEATVEAMRADAEVQANLRKSLALMLDFYGLELSPATAGGQIQ